MFLLPNDCKGECIIKNLYLNSKISSYICVCPYKHTNHIAQKNVEEHLNTNLTGNILERTSHTFLFLFLLFCTFLRLLRFLHWKVRIHDLLFFNWRFLTSLKSCIAISICDYNQQRPFGNHLFVFIK